MRKLFMGLLLLPTLKGLSQVSINVPVIPAGFVQKEQLWNLSLLNGSNDPLSVTIKMSVMEAGSGQVLLSATSGSIMIGKGVKVMSARDAQPISYHYSLPDMFRNSLPTGKYVVCYQVVSQGLKEVAMGEECVPVVIEPLSPPLLMSPMDKSVLDAGYPQFTWMPPAPLEMFSSLNYDLLVVEVLDGQTPNEAVEVNRPVYFRTHLANAYEQYPSGHTQLDTGKVYAWQIVAKNGVNYSAKTEVWTFSRKSDAPASFVKNKIYFELYRTGDAAGYTYDLIEGDLALKFYSFEKPSDATLTIVTQGGKNVFTQKIKIIYGDNFITVPNIWGKLLKEQVHIVEIKTADGRSYMARLRKENKPASKN